MQISVNGQDFSRSAAQFWYNDDVSVTHVSPTNGPPTGGTVLVVYWRRLLRFSQIKNVLSLALLLGTS